MRGSAPLRGNAEGDGVAVEVVEVVGLKRGSEGDVEGGDETRENRAEHGWIDQW